MGAEMEVDAFEMEARFIEMNGEAPEIVTFIKELLTGLIT